MATSIDALRTELLILVERTGPRSTKQIAFFLSEDVAAAWALDNDILILDSEQDECDQVGDAWIERVQLIDADSADEYYEQKAQAESDAEIAKGKAMLDKLDPATRAALAAYILSQRTASGEE